MESELTIKSKAKINLFLHIIGKNQNSYHLLESLVMFADDIYDVIKIKKSNELTLEIDGEFSDKLSIEDNLIIKAANYLRGDNNYGAHITLTKNIPIGSGLGGGSSNAASIIKLLSKLWGIKLTDKIISNLKSIGADVPCCYYEKSTYFSGIGEIIDPLESSHKLHALVIFPNCSISTKDVFEKITKYDQALNKKFLNFSNNELIQFLNNTQNSMQESAIKISSDIKDVIEILKNTNNCQIARMSGSGSSCFGLFTTENDAKAAYKRLISKYSWWIKYSLLS